jgi:hypothetical protein
VNLFGKLFGKKSRQERDGAAARHRAPRHSQEEGGAERPLFRNDPAAPAAGPGSGFSGGPGVASVDPAGAGRIGFGESSGNHAAGGSLPVCSRCGHRNAADSRFCSNCGAPLRAGVTAERPSETTSTISISGLEAYESEATGQTPLPSLSPEAQAAVDALPPGSALLVVRRGPNSGSRFLLDGELTTAGRHPESDIFLDDVTVSRRHVEFRRGPDGGFTVADVGSLNGTYHNRERIDSAPLANGDEVQIGKYRLVFYASQRGF